MRRFAKTLAIAGAALTWVAVPAEATVLKMTLTDVTSATSVTCDNGNMAVCTPLGFGPAFPASNGTLLSFSGTVGSWTSSLTAATTNSPGSLTEATLDLTQLTLANTSGAVRDFQILVTAFGFTTPPGDPLYFFGSASTSSGGVTGIVTSISYFDGTNAGLLTNPITCSFIPGTNNSCAEPTISVANGGGAYSMTQVLNIRLNGGQNINLTANSTAVPEPASLALVGLALAGLGVVSRRRKS